jgi:hypothetical protein
MRRNNSSRNTFSHGNSHIGDNINVQRVMIPSISWADRTAGNAADIEDPRRKSPNIPWLSLRKIEVEVTAGPTSIIRILSKAISVVVATCPSSSHLILE